jgi:intraflagellar transport protein 57
VLLMLADKALLLKHFSFRPIEYPKPKDKADVEKPTNIGEQDEDNNNNASSSGNVLGGARRRKGGFDDIEDRVGDIAQSDDEDDGEDEMFTGIYGSGAGRAAAAQPTQTEVSADVWNMEVERVAPLLQTAVVGIEIRDWRARVEGALTLMKAVDTMYPEVRGMLERVGDDLDKSLDRIRKREQTLGQQFVEQVEEYRGKLRRLNTLQDQFNTVSGRVSGLSSELNNVTATLEDVKAKISEYEEKSSDTTPLVKIKEAVAKVRAEIKEMSLRIGVLQHTVLHYALRQQKERKGKQARGIAAAGKLGAAGTDGHNGDHSSTKEDDHHHHSVAAGGDKHRNNNRNSPGAEYEGEYGGDGYLSYGVNGQQPPMMKGDLDFSGYM